MIRLIAASLAVIALAGCSSAPPATPDPSVLVTTIAPRQGSAPAIVTAYGSAQPSGNGARTMNAAQPGQVLRLAITAGAAVRAGQALLIFETAPASRSSFEQAASAVGVAEKQRATTEQLLAQQLATRDQLAQAEKAVSDARVALTALRRDGAGRPMQTMTAPFDGIVTAINVAPGDRTQPGAALLTIARMSDIVVTVGIDPAEQGKVRAGQNAAMYRLTGGAPIAGRLLRVDNVLNPKTRMIDADISAPAGAILSGEGLRADIATGQAHGWIVPHQAIVTANGPARIFQMVRNKAKAVPIIVIQSGSTTDIVQGAIAANHPIIVDGAYQVEDGEAVRTGH